MAAYAAVTQPPIPPTGYHLRPGTSRDMLSISRLYVSSLGHDRMVDILFPNWRTRPRADILTMLSRHFQKRYWTLGWRLTMLVDESLDAPVGFTWWKKPSCELTFYEKWLSPYAWFAPIMRAYVSVKTFILGTPFPAESLNTFARVLSDIEPQFLNTPRRQNAWYLSTIAVHPLLQGRQLGDVLVRDGLELVDRSGSASYLIGLKTVEKFYPRYGFKEVCRANVADLSDWDGGSIMFRE